MKSQYWICFLFLAGCSTAPVQPTPTPITVQYEFNDYGVAECTVNDEKVKLSEAEMLQSIQNVVDTYCPAVGPEPQETRRVFY